MLRSHFADSVGTIDPLSPVHSCSTKVGKRKIAKDQATPDIVLASDSTIGLYCGLVALYTEL
jgi:hypothetical protein